MIVHRSTRSHRRRLLSPPDIIGSRPRRYIVQAAILCAAAIVAALAWHPAHSETTAGDAYHCAQVASYHHRYAQAEAGFTRARNLTSDPDKAAWAQYQLASCYLAQPAKRSQATMAATA